MVRGVPSSKRPDEHGAGSFAVFVHESEVARELLLALLEPADVLLELAEDEVAAEVHGRVRCGRVGR